MGSLGGWEIVIIIGVLLLLFGAKKLPDMARSVGQSARVFKGEMKGLKEDGKPEDKPAPAPLPPATSATQPAAAQPAAAQPVAVQPVAVQPVIVEPTPQPTQAPGSTPGQ